MEQKNCPYCKKTFEGFSKKQVDGFVLQHIVAKHPEKVVFADNNDTNKDKVQ